MFARHVLIADHDYLVLDRIGSELSLHECEIFLASAADEMLDIAAANPCDTAFIDADLSDGDGLEAARTLTALCPDTLVTVTGSREFLQQHARELVHAGFDFQQSPLLVEPLLVVIRRNEQIQRLRRENQMLKNQWEDDRGLDDFISRSPKMIEALRQAATAAEGAQPIIIYGPPGTEKEIFALYIHRCSPRADKLFVRFECGRITGPLEEIELFGHSAGYALGRIGLAQGGTLFLDNISRLSLGAQSRLLRIIDQAADRRIEPEPPGDIRVICASPLDLRSLAAETFRSDLLYRLTGLSIAIPPLADRRMDILPLVNRFLFRFGLQQGKPIRAVSAETARQLLAYDWPGNVQELKDSVRLAVAAARQTFLTPADFARGPFRPAVTRPAAPHITESTLC